MKTLLENIDCRICQTKQLSPIRSLYGKRSKALISVYKCNNCYSLFTNPIEYQKIQNFDWDGIDYHLKGEDIKKARAKNIISLACNNYNLDNNNKKFLDIGCGLGFAMLAAQEMGFKTYGIEPQTKISQYARDVLKLDVKNGLFDPDMFEENYFDFIFADQVLEHVTHPKDFFDDIFKILKPNGIIFIGVPPVDWLRLSISKLVLSLKKLDFSNSIEEKLQKITSRTIDPVFYDPEEHINYISEEAIKILLKDNNAHLLSLYSSKALLIKLFPMLRLTSGSYLIQAGYE